MPATAIYGGSRQFGAKRYGIAQRVAAIF
ncbi:hypothetical protein IL54_3125 [Sphingobium sp. ba1]|nr:hypothetical protein IL54_3125 [Sphingobium sp. ba1]